MVMGYIGVNADKIVTFVATDLYGSVYCTESAKIGNLSDLISHISNEYAAFLSATLSTCSTALVYIAIGDKNVTLYDTGFCVERNFVLSSFKFDKIEDVTGKVVLL